MGRKRSSFAVAFTLIELLVILAVIGVLIAIMLPGIQRIRESSRRCQCSDRIRRLVLAVHQYHDANNAMPPFGVGGKDSQLSPHVLLLPLISQVERWDALTRIGFEAKPFHAFHPSWLGPLSDLACPSDPHANVPENVSTPANYCYSDGDLILEHCQEDSVVTREDKILRRGAFPVCGFRNLADVTDGLSNTLFLSERCIGTSTTRTQVKGGIAYSVETVRYGPITCLNYRGERGRYDLTRKGTDGVLETSGETGTFYGFWGFHCVRFTTILPPNSPSCSHSSEIANDHALYPPTAYHVGGANGAWGDGAVTLIAETIDSGDLTVSALNLQSEQSPYGIWGAAGSINGAEFPKQIFPIR